MIAIIGSSFSKFYKIILLIFVTVIFLGLILVSRNKEYSIGHIKQVYKVGVQLEDHILTVFSILLIIFGIKLIYKGV